MAATIRASHTSAYDSRMNKYLFDPQPNTRASSIHTGISRSSISATGYCLWLTMYRWYHHLIHHHQEGQRHSLSSYVPRQKWLQTRHTQLAIRVNGTMWGQRSWQSHPYHQRANLWALRTALKPSALYTRCLSVRKTKCDFGNDDL